MLAATAKNASETENSTLEAFPYSATSRAFLLSVVVVVGGGCVVVPPRVGILAMGIFLFGTPIYGTTYLQFDERSLVCDCSSFSSSLSSLVESELAVSGSKRKL